MQTNAHKLYLFYYFPFYSSACKNVEYGNTISTFPNKDHCYLISKNIYLLNLSACV